jgi:hypothetical protein
MTARCPSQIGGLLDCIMSVSCPTVPSTGGEAPAAYTAELQQRTIDETTYDVFRSVPASTSSPRYPGGGLRALTLTCHVSLVGTACESALGSRFLGAWGALHALATTRATPPCLA